MHLVVEKLDLTISQAVAATDAGDGFIIRYQVAGSLVTMSAVLPHTPLHGMTRKRGMNFIELRKARLLWHNRSVRIWPASIALQQSTDLIGAPSHGDGSGRLGNGREALQCVLGPLPMPRTGSIGRRHESHSGHVRMTGNSPAFHDRVPSPRQQGLRLQAD